MLPLRYIVLTLFLAPVCFARLGETAKELQTRYGTPLFVSDEKLMSEGRFYTIGTQLEFKSDDWRFTCVVTDDRCSKIIYTKTGSWTESQVMAVLNANAQGSSWTKTSRDSKTLEGATWQRGDGTLASLSIGRLKLIHPAYNRAVSIAEAKAKAAASTLPKKL